MTPERTHHDSESTLLEQASSYLKKNGATDVPQLYSILKAKNPAITEAEVTELVWHLVEGGQAELDEIAIPAISLVEYLKIWEKNLWFYASIIMPLITVLVIYIFPTQFPLVALRWILGSLLVLFIPGYVTVEALFPKARELDTLERFALSVGLSLAMVPLVGFLLNFTPWGIRLEPILISLTILTVALALVALRRQYAASVNPFQ